MSYDWFVILLISFIGVSINYHKFLKSLLFMEFIMIVLFGFIMLSIYGVGHFLLFFLIMGICEGVLGLLSLILVYRWYSSDNYFLLDYDIF